jgi:dsDNA-specific endonuclease/ATPase MutS2
VKKDEFVTEASLNQKPKPVVDLHIEKLTDSISSLTAQEILDLQMKVFSKSLEMAHVHQMNKIVFIHGIGNHFLKNRIKNFLAQQKSIVKKYQDADALKYGGGATEVLLG